MMTDELRSKEQYTKEQIRRCIDNMVIILEMTEKRLDNKDLELIYTCANDSLVRLEGITHYPEE